MQRTGLHVAWHPPPHTRHTLPLRPPSTRRLMLRLFTERNLSQQLPQALRR